MYNCYNKYIKIFQGTHLLKSKADQWRIFWNNT